MLEGKINSNMRNIKSYATTVQKNNMFERYFLFSFNEIFSPRAVLGHYGTLERRVSQKSKRVGISNCW